jgi:hypothetical protein
MSVGDGKGGSIAQPKNRRNRGGCKALSLGAKTWTQKLGRKTGLRRVAAREDEMNAVTEDKVSAVRPERLHQALGIYQSALVAGEPENADGSPTESESVRGILAVKREFPDPQEFLSLRLRLERFTEIVSDKKLIKWGMVKHSEGGLEVHDAVVNALAAAPIRKSGVLDKDAFHALVKAEFTRLEAAEK